MLISNLGVGPVSREVIRAVYAASDFFSCPLMLICSRNQVDYDRGYVVSTSELRAWTTGLMVTYPTAKVILCRDHGGPGFRADERINLLEPVQETFRHDLLNGFTLFHIDLCRYPVSEEKRLEATCGLMVDILRQAKDLGLEVGFEIGTDENTGEPDTDEKVLRRRLHRVKEVRCPLFYVVRTGTLVHGLRNKSTELPEAARRMAKVVHDGGVLVKEHNADLMPMSDILARQGIIHAMNIAPQMGMVQTSVVLQAALIVGVDVTSFQDRVYAGDLWHKWLAPHQANLWSCALAAGHYYYQSFAYQHLVDRLAKELDIKTKIHEALVSVIGHYLRGYGRTHDGL